MADNKVSAEVADWSRERKRRLSWDPSRSLIATLRDYQRQAASRSGLVRLVMKVTVLRHRFWSVVTGADIPLNCDIDGGLLMPHPNGIVIHPHCRIGPNCLLFHQVTLGMIDGRGPPMLGGHVDVGAGAKILGDVKIGDHAKIGANSVVLCDVPPGKTAVGVPARIID